MADIKLKQLFGKLNRSAYLSVESATTSCKMRGNPHVELAHWIQQILELPDSDLHRVVREFDLDTARLAHHLTAALDRLPRGATSIAGISWHVQHATERGWVYASLMFGAGLVRTGHLLIGILKTPDLRNALHAVSREFEKIGVDDLVGRFVDITGDSPEAKADAETMPSGDEADAFPTGPAPELGGQEALQRFTSDLTETARGDDVDPIVGRDHEIRQVVDILLRRRQNNPILTGEAGVGKTAVVEGFAQRIVAGDVPPALAQVSLRALDVGLLQAGASMKGEVESRLHRIIDEVQASPRPVILFIDEAHTLIGAGGAAGTGDLANLLKPALARGTLRTIAATTWAEYKQHIEKDPALTRRFQVVKVEEPEPDRALRMMRAIAHPMECHHEVQILDEALEASVNLSRRYIPGRYLPDKAVSLLDTASARVAVSLHSVPPEVEDARRNLDSLDREIAIIEREAALGVDIGDRLEEATEAREREHCRLQPLEDQWKREKELVTRILEIRETLQPIDRSETPPEGDEPERPSDAPDEEQRHALQAELSEIQTRLRDLQGEHPLLLPTVDAQAVASVVGDWTGIPVGRMIRNEIESILELPEILSQRVIGQQYAIDLIAQRAKISRARLDNPGKPLGVFLLCGPSGVGKTETALALGEALYGGEQNVITINMSEFQERHTVSTLKGAPPGYKGYGRGGVLTEAVRRRPYSVVLLDEVEKAHRDVHEIFFQVFDKGWMEDAEGTRIDFRNTLILLTSNVGTELITSLCGDSDLLPTPESLTQALRRPLLEVFPAALLGRLVVVPFFPLADDTLAAIARLHLDRIVARILEQHQVTLDYDEEVLKTILARCVEVESGGRMIDSIITNTILPRISHEILQRAIEGQELARITIGVADSEFTYSLEDSTDQSSTGDGGRKDRPLPLDAQEGHDAR